MKRILFLVFVLASCKKEANHSGDVSMMVVDKVTNTPIKGAAVSVSRASTVLLTTVTDGKGSFQLASEYFNDATIAINITKEKYWDNAFSKTSILKLVPEGWLQVRVHKTGTYPALSKIILEASTTPEKDMTTAKCFMTPSDSTINIRAVGGQQHELDWRVTDANDRSLNSGALSNLQVPRFDTVKNITVDY